MSLSTPSCTFCDSKRHNETDCLHTFNGRRDILEGCMLMDEMPDFNSYTKKELKFVAYITPNKKTILRTMGSNEWEYKPIPLTLCKSKMENALKDRWGSLREASKHEKHPICNTGCSICSGNRKETYCWSIENGGWSLSESESKYEEKFTTKCGHTFCKPCLDTVDWWPDSFYKRPKSKHPIPNHISHHMSTGITLHYKKCPDCKTVLYQNIKDLLREDYYYNELDPHAPLKLET
mgnify:FL=1